MFKGYLSTAFKSEMFSLLADWESKVALYGASNNVWFFSVHYLQSTNDFPFKLLVWKEVTIKRQPWDKISVRVCHSAVFRDMFISCIDWVKFHCCFSGICRVLSTALHPRLNLSNNVLLKMSVIWRESELTPPAPPKSIMNYDEG